MFDNLSLKLDRAFKTLKGTGKITEINVASTVKEIRRALIDADVNYKVAKEVTDKIKEEAMGRDVLISVSPGQLLVKINPEKAKNFQVGFIAINKQGEYGGYALQKGFSFAVCHAADKNFLVNAKPLI